MNAIGRIFHRRQSEPPEVDDVTRKLLAYPENARRERVDNIAYSRRTTEAVHHASERAAHETADHLVAHLRAEAMSNPLVIDSVLDALADLLSDDRHSTGMYENTDVLPEPAFDSERYGWSSAQLARPPARVLETPIRWMSVVADRVPWRYLVWLAMASASVAAIVLVSGHPVLALIPIGVFAVADFLDGAAERRQGATNLAIYLACLGSHFCDLVLIGGVLHYGGQIGETVAVQMFVVAVIASLFSSFARAALYQVAGDEVPRAWLERAMRVVAVTLAIVTGSTLVGAAILGLYAVFEFVEILRIAQRENVKTIYSFTRLSPRRGRRTPWRALDEDATVSGSGLWRCQQRKSEPQRVRVDTLTSTSSGRRI